MKKYNVFLCAIAMLLLAMIAGGGCNGSSGGDGGRIAMEMTGLTTNEEGVPHVFALPDGAQQVIISDIDIKAGGNIRVLKKVQADEHDWGVFGDPVQIKSVLLPPRVVTEQSVDSPDVTISHDVRDTDVFKFPLAAGVLYSVELSRNLIQGTDGFIPELMIIDTSVDSGQDDVDVDSGTPAPDDEEDPEGEILESGIISDFSFTAEPKGGAPAVMLWTFTPPKSGVYAIRVSNAEHQFDEGRDQRTDYMLRVYKEQGVEGNYGHPIALTIEGQDLTLGEVLTLRDALMRTGVERGEEGEEDARPEELKTDSFGLPIVPEEFRKGAASVRALADDSADNGNNGPLTQYQSRMETMQMVKGAVSDESYLSPVVNGVKPYKDDDMELGAGYMAITGLRGSIASAVDITSTELPPIAEPETDYWYHFISSKQDQINETSLTVKGSYSAVAATIKSENTYSSKVQYSQTSTTLVVHYHYRDKNWAIPVGGLGVFKLKDKAKSDLQAQGIDAFRQKYGDYFVTGRRRGARVDAYITIKADSSTKIDQIKSTLGVKGGKWDVSTEFQKKLTNALEGTETEIAIHTDGVPKTAISQPTTIEGLMDYVDKFSAAATSDDFKYVTLDVQLRSYANVFGDELFPTMLNVPQDHFVNLNNFCYNIMELDAQYNALSSIPLANLADGKTQQDAWTSEYRTMKDTIEAGIVDICKTKEALLQANTKLSLLNIRFNALNECWAFYKKLLQAQEQNKKDHKDQGFGSWGFWTFNSSYVMQDFRPMVYESYKEKYKFNGYRHWYPSKTCTSENGVWAFLQTKRNSKGGYVDQEPLPTIGSHKYSMHFKSARTRGGNWEYWAREFNLDPKKYPFFGLDSNHL